MMHKKILSEVDDFVSKPTPEISFIMMDSEANEEVNDSEKS
jgi:hypothetical protein